MVPATDKYNAHMPRGTPQLTHLPLDLTSGVYLREHVEQKVNDSDMQKDGNEESPCLCGFSAGMQRHQPSRCKVLTIRWTARETAVATYLLD